MTNRNGGTAAEVFDYVIVGAGAAGSILANRLSEDAGATVCLLESGPRDWHPFLHIPAGFIKVLFNPAFTWQFSTEPGENTKGRRVPVPVGRTLGGSTAINGLVYNRGLPSDYDAWAAAGNRGWSFAEVLPYFKRTERKIGVGDDRFHGRKGEMPITDMDWIHPICEAFIAGAQTEGIPRNPDYNGARQEGVGYYQRNILHGWRQTTARTFLRPARKRPNLEVRTQATATSVIFEGKRAVGVRYVRSNAPGNKHRGTGAARSHPELRCDQHAAVAAALRRRTRRAAAVPRCTGRARAARRRRELPRSLLDPPRRQGARQHHDERAGGRAAPAGADRALASAASQYPGR